MADATPLPETPVKTCVKCKATKPLDEFFRRTGTKSGRNSWCKACHREYQSSKPVGTCKVDGCARATSSGQPKCDSCYAGGPPLAQGLRTRGMFRYDEQGNRLCSHCLEYLAVSEFGVNSRVSDGLSRVCRACTQVKMVFKKYGLTIAEADRMWASPCSICGFFEAGEMVIDHCHDSGGVRGTLCHPCNVSIGHFRDDPDLLERAAQYLRRSACAQANQGHLQPMEDLDGPRATDLTNHKSRKQNGRSLQRPRFRTRGTAHR